MAHTQGNGQTTLSTTDGQRVTDLTAWPTRAEVANELGCSVSLVRKWERQEKLHPIPDAEGTMRFQRAEVDNLKNERGNDDELVELDRATNHTLEANLAGRMVALLARPREVLDNLLLKEIERSHRRIAELEDKLANAFAAKEAALSEVAQRETFGKILEAESKHKREIMSRVVGKLETLFGPKGKPFLTSLKPDQLEELLALPDYWNDGQKVAIAAALSAARAEMTTPSSSSEATNKETAK